jgi:hypothetical protein
MLPHAGSKLCFWLMRMFEIFKLEFVVWLDLNSKGKTKRKGNRNSDKKKNPNQPSRPLPPAFRPIWPTLPRARLHTLSARRARPIGASQAALVRPLPLSPSARGSRLSAPIPLARVRPLPLFSLYPLGPRCQRFSLVRALPPADPWASPVRPVPPTVRAHDSAQAVDSAPMTHAEAATAPPRPFSSDLHPHSLLPPSVAPPTELPHPPLTAR